jgi:hypothetical protein
MGLSDLYEYLIEYLKIVLLTKLVIFQGRGLQKEEVSAWPLDTEFVMMS